LDKSLSKKVETEIMFTSNEKITQKEQIQKIIRQVEEKIAQ
jgi:hypothetical protein